MQMRYESKKQEKIHELLRKENLLQQEIIVKHKFRIWLLYGSILCISLVSFWGYLKFISKNKYALRLFRKINKAISIQKKQEQNLIHQSVLTKIGELATFIIHDLKQPLQDIKLSAEDIETSISSDQPNYQIITNSISDIFVDVERISCMTDYVINSTNKKSYDKEIEFDTNESIANAYRMIRRQFSRQNITLHLKLADNLPSIMGNPWKFEHSLLNILSNSCYAMREARKFKENVFQENFTIESYSNNNHVFIKIIDNGIGVIDSFKPKIFHPFNSSKEPGKGTGLGLSIVYEVVRQMQGNLEFSSSPFRGTTVTLIFPTASKRDEYKSAEDKLRAQLENSSARR
jgi:signal transduction histidine kinase